MILGTELHLCVRKCVRLRNYDCVLELLASVSYNLLLLSLIIILFCSKLIYTFAGWSVPITVIEQVSVLCLLLLTQLFNMQYFMEFVSSGLQTLHSSGPLARQSFLKVHKTYAPNILFYIQAPAVDVVAVGLQNGKIFLHNLKFDEIVMRFMQDWGAVTSISFRTGELHLSRKLRLNLAQ